MEITRYHFELITPVNVDAQVVRLTRYTFDDCAYDKFDDPDCDESYKAEVLYEDGWHEFQGFEVLDLSRMPHIDGIEAIRRQKYMDVLHEFETRIRDILKDAGVYRGMR